MAHLLSQKGIKVGLVESKKVGSGASSAAGCWVNPSLKPQRSTRLTQFMNDAFYVATNFYSNLYAFSKTGVLIKRDKPFMETASALPFSYVTMETRTNETDIFVPDAGFISNPVSILHEILSRTPLCTVVEETPISSLKRESDHWILNNVIITKKLVLCPGYDLTLVNEEYLKTGIRKVWGEVITLSLDDPIVPIPNTITTPATTAINIEGDGLLIFSRDGLTVTLGSTHIVNESLGPAYSDFNKKERIGKLIEAAQKHVSLPNHSYGRIQSIRSGTRAMACDYFPVIGPVVSSSLALHVFPSITQGQDVRKFDVPFYPDMYLLTGLGGRGFVLAPYLSNVLCNIMYNRMPVPFFLSTARLFQRWARKQK
eukprot:TRINITY_DN9496_c0_g1_i6.p1 TRINITY_DN9496_c0_g1~~TRINITY_DN9496_c0_g1_i6.p1  ORF type:complete len:408 (-),score=63.38 TRINITY_DN9496_c0_g1_i6:17-1126(-)